MTARGEQQPFRPGAATSAERVRWPAGWGTRFLVFVDVEEEFDWSLPPDRAQRAVTAIRALPDAHRRFADHAVPLACMVDYPVAVDVEAAAILRAVAADGRSTIGAQLHAWVTPPFVEALTPANSYAGNLPRAQQAAKLDGLTDAIGAAVGVRPVAYRAGRYGIGPDTATLLRERGYRVDSSMRARYDYRSDGGPDFTAIDAHAFRRDGLLELPLTTVFTGRVRALGSPLHATLGRIRYARGMAARTGLLSRIALTPEDMPIAAARAAVDAAIADGVGLLVFSFHSPSLVPGHTPYVRDAADLAAFWRWWTVMFDHLGARGVASATLAEVLDAAG